MAQQGTVLQELGERIAGFHWDGLGTRAVRWAKTAIVDTVGVTLAGSGEPAARRLRAVPGVAGVAGRCLIIGTAAKTSALDAALVNGTAAHVLDYDDGNQVLAGHPSAVMLPALIALAEDRGADGKALITAYAAGLEVAARLGRSVNQEHYEKGWHPTATLGVFGASAACARLIGLEASATTMALGIAASFAAGVKANFGSMTKSLHCGHAARGGVFAALLAEQGYTADASAMDGPQGFLNVYNGSGGYRIDPLLAQWTAPFEIESPANSIKPFPCCASTHGAAAVALELRARHALAPGDIERIEVLVHRRRIPHTDKPDPGTALAAKFSMQYVVATALANGRVGLADFEGDAWRDPLVRSLMACVRYLPDLELPEDTPNDYGARIRVLLRSGASIEHAVLDYPGPSPAVDFDEAQVWRKFEDCAARALPAGQVADLAAALGQFEDLPVAEATRHMESR